MGLLAGLLGGVVAVGVLLAASAWQPGHRAPVLRRGSVSDLVPTVVAAVVGAVVVLAVTGWIVGAVVGAAAGVLGVRWFSRRATSPRAEQERIEALATWCEQLRDLLAADQGIVGTIGATASTCPPALRPNVVALATRLGRQEAATAIGRFADEVDDPSADLVATVLLEATKRSSRTSELLSELAVTIRERAAMRLRIEAERAGHRSEARFVVGFSAAVVMGIVLFGRDSEFLDAFDDAEGQVVLAIVAAFFAGGTWWLARLTRFERPARFLTFAPADRPGSGIDPTAAIDGAGG